VTLGASVLAEKQKQQQGGEGRSTDDLEALEQAWKNFSDLDALAGPLRGMLIGQDKDGLTTDGGERDGPRVCLKFVVVYRDFAEQLLLLAKMTSFHEEDDVIDQAKHVALLRSAVKGLGDALEAAPFGALPHLLAVALPLLQTPLPQLDEHEEVDGEPSCGGSGESCLFSKGLIHLLLLRLHTLDNSHRTNQIREKDFFRRFQPGFVTGLRQALMVNLSLAVIADNKESGRVHRVIVADSGSLGQDMTSESSDRNSVFLSVDELLESDTMTW